MSSRRSSRAVRPHEVVAALAHELSARVPTIFVLEDLHWADEATLDVLRLLARRVATVPALVIASYRDDELDPRIRSESCSESSRRPATSGG